MRDAFLDAGIAECEWPIGDWPTDPSLMEQRHRGAVEAGLLDPDEPTPYTHWLYQQEITKEFTSMERAQVRITLGMLDG